MRPSFLNRGERDFTATNISHGGGLSFMTGMKREPNGCMASENLEEVSLFAFNEDMTLIKHTTASIQSSFYISDSWQNEDGENIFYFFVTSDVGNKYLMIVDYVNKNVRFVNNERSRMSKWITKKAWINE